MLKLFFRYGRYLGNVFFKVGKTWHLTQMFDKNFLRGLGTDKISLLMSLARLAASIELPYNRLLMCTLEQKPCKFVGWAGRVR